MNLSYFQKPSRYINSEINAHGVQTKSGPPVSFALAFPDIYEVGMSHLGLRILYHVLNSMPHTVAERFFSPWTDLEAHMRQSGTPLSSLESGTPLRDFDIAGFSLQYELSYTTVLNMLHLGGIPLRSLERLNTSGHFPLVVAGGPCTVNPAPMAAFIDAFLIGEGEEAVVELAGVVGRWKKEGDGRPASLLKEVSLIQGFYVPSLHAPGTGIKRRFIADLNAAPYPERPVVPYTSIVHDRVTVEVSRGCDMGCRFCQAGMIYRPLRDRDPGRVISIAENSLRNTGHEEVSFVSLSAGDYPHLLGVVRECNRRFSGSKIAVSLPSLRVASVNRDVLREIRSIRKTGFTMAPEAATQRLRNVINKDFIEKDYERALSSLFEEGWLSLKLYFMIGLPTETEEDLSAIKDMVMKALKTAKKNTGKFVNINVTISPFIPKAHTPFQWFGQEPYDKLKAKLSRLRGEFSGKKFKYKGHNVEMSLLEAVFARGGEDLSDLIETAWKSGRRLDAWSELFDFGGWMDAMDKTGLDAFAYAGRSFEKDAPLPWDIIDTGIKKEFLLREYERALSAENTPACRKSCSACGLRCRETGLPGDVPKTVNITNGVVRSAASEGAAKLRVRACFSKSGRLKYLSHLELMTALMRAMRRAEWPFDFTRGFHPSPKLSLGPPLSVGVSGEREYFDVEVFVPFDIEFYMGRLNDTLPSGLAVLKMETVPQNGKSLTGFINRYCYLIRACRDSLDIAGTVLPRPDFIPGREMIVRRDGTAVDIGPCIEGLDFSADKGGSVRLTLVDRGDVRVRIGEIAEALFSVNMRDLDITRTAMYGWEDGWKEPLRQMSVIGDS